MRTKERREAIGAHCMQPDCDFDIGIDFGTSRQIRKRANQHAARTGHTVVCTYETSVFIRRSATAPASLEQQELTND